MSEVLERQRRSSRTDKVHTMQVAYDVADRVRLITYPDNRAVIACSYDEVVHLVKAKSREIILISSPGADSHPFGGG